MRNDLGHVYEGYNKPQLVAINPILTLGFMDIKFKAIVEYLLSDVQPLGKVMHYFWRREYQARGLSHFTDIFLNI